MKIEKVLLSTKKTALEHYKERSDFLEELLPPEELRDIRAGHEAHYESLDGIRKVLSERNIEFARSYMPYTEYSDFRDKDLVICVGGDGTVLNSAQYILDKTPILTVKSDRRSTGALCEIEAREFGKALDRIQKDDFRIEEWTRAEGHLRGRRLFALNEIFVGVRHSATMARYELEFDGISEFQMSSGIVVSTGTGSTGWYRNIPGSHGKFPKSSRELRFIVREHSVAARYHLTEGILASGKSLVVKSKMNVDGCVSFDGDISKRMFEFVRGDQLEIKSSDTPVRVVRLG